jgi:hypothetical protein
MCRLPISSPLLQKIKLETKDEASANKYHGSFNTSPNWYSKKGFLKIEKKEGFQSTLSNAFGLTRYVKEGIGTIAQQTHLSTK